MAECEATGSFHELCLQRHCDEQQVQGAGAEQPLSAALRQVHLCEGKRPKRVEGSRGKNMKEADSKAVDILGVMERIGN